MKSHYRVAVIGGGVVGCSVLYHLTKLGWSDVVLLERKELTAGSSWHAAGGFHALNSDPGVARLQSYTISLYREIEALSGQDVGMHMTGGLNLAATQERWDIIRADHARHRVLGLETQLLTPAEVKEKCEIVDVTGVLGALFDPREGHVDPSGATWAYAKAAQKAGAEIYRRTRVMDLVPTGRGSWRVITDQGEIEADHVVNAGGLWAREMGAMVGVQLPLTPMEHHYLITEDLPELIASDREIPLVLDLDGEIYMRQERKGVLLGVYEKDATPWAVNGTPWDYAEDELLPPNLDRLSDALVKGFGRFPSLSRAGIKRIVNGPFTFTPDGNPLVGPVREVPHYWSACGVMAGFAQGGGVGLSLAQWIIEGEPEGDIFAMDVARFGDYASPAYVSDKAREFYARRFQIAYPNEYWPAGRPLKTDPLYDALEQKNAVFGVSYGLETPLYFETSGSSPSEEPSLTRSSAFQRVAEECAAVRDGVGIFDSGSFGKYEFVGPGAEAALDHLFASRLPGVGRARLAPMLSETGRLMGDMTAMRLASDRFLVFGSGYLQNWHMRWFEARLDRSDVRLTNVSDSLQGVTISGPKARELLARAAGADVDSDSLPFMAVREMDVGLCRATVARVSLSGELSYEIWTPAAQVRSLYRCLQAAGADMGLRDYGVYALLSMRLEKGYGIWSREFSRDYTPSACGIDRFVNYAKPAFLGRDAALRDRDAPSALKLALFSVKASGADAAGYEPIWHDGKRVGFVTSGGYGHRVGESLALGYVPRALAGEETPFEISVLGIRHASRLQQNPLYDPNGGRARA